MESLSEIIFIGLPGPTHHYGGLSADNVASSRNRGLVSSPKLAARQALSLGRALSALGIRAGFLPPQQRPYLPMLAECFPQAKDAEALIAIAGKDAPQLLEAAASSSAMWSANAATVSPTVDNADGQLHLTTANLYTNRHRRIEAQDSYALLCSIFAQVPGSEIHAPLPASQRDEGAANHMRLAPRHSAEGLNVFVYGADGNNDAPSARQDLSASEAIAQTHQMKHTLFIKQNPDIIRLGVFHNDVIAVSNENVLLVHERAYAGSGDIQRIESEYEKLTGEKLTTLLVTSDMLSVEEAVHTYLFNSQIVTKANGNMAIIAPTEVGELYDGKALKVLEAFRDDSDNPVDEIITLDLRQSMRNGGGPACLRLRVVVTASQLAALEESVNVLANDKLITNLDAIIDAYYPEELTAAQLADPALYYNCEAMRGMMLTLMGLKD